MILKMITISGAWYVIDGDRVITFEKAYDAWCYIYLLKAIRPKAPKVERSLYPVKTLNPCEEGRKKYVRVYT
jgi:hypothetical protein